ncbi:glycosyltransferase [Streptococcus halichoeri]|uniref:glycosyltransferase n=1 Tax=Streptococcus halichoeri TaxID=254785 RepID=UPI001C8DAE49|nr:glycosyltransferase [Streptococcus halichoeri]
MVKTAVLMATYNGQAFILSQLDSIRRQTLQPDYVLMRDDGSTDQTVALVTDYITRHQLTGWSITRNSKNLGWRLNFRQLMSDATELDVDYIFFSDQDDTWYADKNQLQVQMMQKHPQIDLLSADIDIETIGDAATVPHNYQFADSQALLSKYPLDYTYHNYRQGWTFCMRHSFLKTIIKHYSKDLVVSHDNLTTGIAGLLGTGYNLNQAVGLHRRHGGNASGHLLNIHSTHARQIYELNLVLGYFTIAKAVLHEKQSKKEARITQYYHFYQQRLENARSRHLWKTLQQMCFEGEYYDTFSNRIRDLIFIFKK